MAEVSRRHSDHPRRRQANRRQREEQPPRARSDLGPDRGDAFLPNLVEPAYVPASLGGNAAAASGAGAGGGRKVSPAAPTAGHGGGGTYGSSQHIGRLETQLSQATKEIERLRARLKQFEHKNRRLGQSHAEQEALVHKESERHERFATLIKAAEGEYGSKTRRAASAAGRATGTLTLSHARCSGEPAAAEAARAVRRSDGSVPADAQADDHQWDRACHVQRFDELELSMPAVSRGRGARLA